MKNITRYSILIFIIIFINNSFSQQREGVIKYSASLNMTFFDKSIKDLEQNEMPKSHKTFITNTINSAHPIVFKLKIKNNESIFLYIPGLLVENEKYNTTEGVAGIDMFYTNNNLNEIIEKNSFLGNVKYSPLKWKITNETKKIGKYNCYKATTIEKSTNISGPKVDEVVIAWFTLEIPINFGPKHYSGLPGLVLEVEKKKFFFKAVEINFDPKEEISIVKPKGQSIPKKEAEAIFAKMYADREKMN